LKKKKTSKEFNAVELVSKGLDEITIQDFPLRGKFVYYTLNAVVGQIKLLAKSLKDWLLVAKGCTHINGLSIPKHRNS
jgi:hypothetical protein